MTEHNDLTAPIAPTDPQPLQEPAQDFRYGVDAEGNPNAPLVSEDSEVEAPAAEKRGYHDIVPPLVNAITGKQWLGIRRRFDMDTQDLGSDVTGQLMLACWKKNLQETGKSEWEWLDDMTHEDYLAYLGVDTDGEDDEADKSGA
jgi:hypothetical protein